jgi:hypothetical protein
VQTVSNTLATERLGRRTGGSDRTKRIPNREDRHPSNLAPKTETAGLEPKIPSVVARTTCEEELVSPEDRLRRPWIGLDGEKEIHVVRGG